MGILSLNNLNKYTFSLLFMAYTTAQEMLLTLNKFTPEWNNLRVHLQDLQQAENLRNNFGDTWASVIESYELKHYSPGMPFNPSQIDTKVHGKPYLIGEAWKPLSVRIHAEGHSYVHQDHQVLWPELLKYLKGRINRLVKRKGYEIVELRALKNQKTGFPCLFDAEETLEYKLKQD